MRAEQVCSSVAPFQSSCFVKLFPLLVIVLSFTLSGFVAGADVVIHQGRELRMATGFGEGPSYQEVFKADEGLMSRQPAVDLFADNPPLSIAQAASSIEKKLTVNRVVVLKAEVLNYAWETGNRKGNSLKGVLFYKLEVLTPNSISEYVVLMDGTVIEPVKEEKKTDKTPKK